MELFHNGFFGLIVLVLDIWALIHIIGSDRGVGSKVFWVILVLILPLLGFFIWLIFGPRTKRSSST
jgi:hypothetical protein